MCGISLAEDVSAGVTKVVGQFFAVARQYRANIKRGFNPQAFQETRGGGSFIGLNLDLGSVAGPVDGSKQVTMLRLVGHLRQTFRIDR